MWRQKRRTNGEKRKEKESLERSNKTERPFMVGNLLKNRSPASLSLSLSLSLSDKRSSMWVRVIRVSNVTRGSVARSKNNLEMKREES